MKSPLLPVRFEPLTSRLQVLLIEWRFMPLSTVFQLYHGDSSHYSCLSLVSPALGWSSDVSWPEDTPTKDPEDPAWLAPRIPYLQVKYFTTEPHRTPLPIQVLHLTTREHTFIPPTLCYVVQVVHQTTWEPHPSRFVMSYNSYTKPHGNPHPSRFIMSYSSYTKLHGNPHPSRFVMSYSSYTKPHRKPHPNRFIILYSSYTKPHGTHTPPPRRFVMSYNSYTKPHGNPTPVAVLCYPSPNHTEHPLSNKPPPPPVALLCYTSSIINIFCNVKTTCCLAYIDKVHIGLCSIINSFFHNVFGYKIGRNYCLSYIPCKCF